MNASKFAPIALGLAALLGATTLLGATGCLVSSDDESFDGVEESELDLEADPLGSPQEVAEPDPEPWTPVGVPTHGQTPDGKAKIIRPKAGPGTPGHEGSDGEGSGAHD